MTYRSLYIILFLLINISATSAKKLPPVYLDGLLVKIDIDTKECTWESSDCSNSIYTIKNNKNKARRNTYRYREPTQTTYTKTSYYFEIKIDDLKYRTLFVPKWADNIHANWVIGKPIQVRFNDKKNRLYLLRPNGKELKTKILKITNE
jgi:hypothetical protein